MTTLRTVYRFEGPKTDLNAIRAKLNRVARSPRLMRVELRISSQAAMPIHLGHARTALMDLLRERGLKQVAVSVRPFDLPLDDALGEHQLTLVEAPRPPSWWARWMARLHSRWLRPGAPAAGGVRLEPACAGVANVAVSKTAPQGESDALSRQAMAQLMRRAARSALRGLPDLDNVEWDVQAIEVRVRSRELHAVAKSMVPSGATAMVQWLASQGNRTDLHATAQCRVVVELLPDPACETGQTYMVGEGDVSIDLEAQPSGSSSVLAGTETPVTL